MGRLSEGRHVTVRVVADGLDIAARVARTTDDLVVLESPAVVGGRHPIEPGAAVEIRWRERRNDVVLSGIVERSAATLDVRLVRERRRGPRRAYVRTNALIGLEITTQVGAVIRGVGMDVSAVGMRARIGAPFAIGDHLRVLVRLPDGEPVEVVARVVRHHARSVAGLAFVEPPKAVTERLIRFVLWTQQRELARRRAAVDTTAPGSFRHIRGDGTAAP